MARSPTLRAMPAPGAVRAPPKLRSLSGLLGLACLAVLAGWPGAIGAQAPAAFLPRAHIPLVMVSAPRVAQPAVRYEAITVEGSPTDRPAAQHPDLNLAIRGYSLTDAATSLIDISGPADPSAPRLSGLLPDSGAPDIAAVYRVNAWDWSLNSLGAALASPEVTLVGLRSTAGQAVALPPSGYIIDSGQYQALVLYAAADRLTAKYTREDDVVWGYTLHVENVTVHPDLLALYRACDAAGRGTLPALRGGQVLGVASGGEVGVAIRDNGTFMDPRSRKDWW